jgi:hypothetical protein
LVLRRDAGATIVRLQKEFSAVLQTHGYALVIDGGGQDAHFHCVAPPDVARRWDAKMIGNGMQLTIIPPKQGLGSEIGG